MILSRDKAGIIDIPMKKKRGIWNLMNFTWGETVNWMSKEGVSMDPHQDIFKYNPDNRTRNTACDACGYTLRDRVRDHRDHSQSVAIQCLPVCIY